MTEFHSGQFRRHIATGLGFYLVAPEYRYGKKGWRVRYPEKNMPSDAHWYSERSMRELYPATKQAA